MMNFWLILFVAGIYLTVSVGYLRERQWGLALAWFAYALANLGFAADDWMRRLSR